MNGSSSMEKKSKAKLSKINMILETKRKVRFKDKVRYFVQSVYFKTVSTLLTLFSLYIDDIRTLSTDHSKDSTFDILCIVLLIFFVGEMLLFFIYEDSYCFSLYFWVDCVGNATSLLDISKFWNKLFLDSSGLLEVDDSKIFFQSLSKYIKILRMVRVTKLVKMYNHFLSESGFGKKKDVEQKDISSSFEESSSKKVILLIILVILAILILNPELYFVYESSYIFILEKFKTIPKESESFRAISRDFFNQRFSSDSDLHLIYANIYGYEYIDMNYNYDIRPGDKLANYVLCDYDSPVYTAEEEQQHQKLIKKYNELYDMEILPSREIINQKCITVFDNRTKTKKLCKMNIIKTSVLLFIFFFVFIKFSLIVDSDVIAPIKNMIIKIDTMAKNPSASMNDESDQKGEGNICSLERIINCSLNDDKEIVETKMLQNKVSKICSLLALGLGEAGSEIICSALHEGANVDINPLIPGKKVIGIYGFCDIRNFTDTTEILRASVMKFVNQVAEIVHELVSDSCGSANKNIGDAFLLVWKFDEKYLVEDENNPGTKRLKKCKIVAQLCDLALISFIQILLQVRKSYKLAVYRSNPDLNKRMPDYKCKLGFGLHLGYSIEGPIGSMFKIDASYLSSHVNMANHLEEQTKPYDKELIISGSFADYISDDARKHLRFLDKIRTKSGEIYRYFTVDLDLDRLGIEKEEDSLFNDKETDKFERLRRKKKKAKQLYYEVTENGKEDNFVEFSLTDNDFKYCREKFTKEYIAKYQDGASKYLAGEWMEAKKSFEEANIILEKNWKACKAADISNNIDRSKEVFKPDKPTQRLMEYMTKTNFVAPKGWDGARPDEED